MKRILVIAVTLTICLASCTGIAPQPTASLQPSPEPTPEPSPEQTDLQALIIVGDEFGNTYFDMKEAMESYDITVVTASVGTADILSSCPNHENIPVTPDIDVAQINEENISDYHVVFIPAGKHHRTIQYSKDVRRVLTLAKEKGIYISAVCAGNIVLASTDGLIKDREIAASSYTQDVIENAGAAPRYTSVVVDGQFVTGGSGGGKTGSGHAGAPIEKMAEELAKLLGAN